MEMDFRSMKRKQLQALCKKHALPANLTNSQMADALSALLLQEKKTEKGAPKGCLKGSGGSDGAAKKVSFTLVEDEEGEERRGVGRKRRLSVGNAGDSEGAVRTRRSIALAKAVVWSPVMERKRARRCTEGVRRIAEVGGGVSLSAEEVPGDGDAEMVVEGEGTEKDAVMVEKKSSAEVPVTRSLRGRAVVVTKAVEKKSSVVTRALRGRAVVVAEGEGVKQDAEEDEKMVEEKPDEVPIKRSLRGRAVVVSEVEEVKKDLEDDKMVEKKPSVVARALRGRAVVVGEGEGVTDEKMAEEKPDEVPIKRSLRGKAVVFGEVEAMKKDSENVKKVEKKSAVVTRALRGRVVVVGEREGEGVKKDAEEDEKMTEEKSDEVPIKRSLRGRDVKVGEKEVVPPRRTLKRTRAVEEAEDEKVSAASLCDKGEGEVRKAEKKSFTEVPATRSLRGRNVVVEGDEPLLGDIERRRTTRRSMKPSKVGAEDSDSHLVGKSGEVEVAEKKDLHKLAETVEIPPEEVKQKVPPPKEAPPRRSRRAVSKPESLQTEAEKQGTDEAGAEEASLVGNGIVGDDAITVGRKKSRKQRDTVTLEQDSDSVAETAPSETMKGKQLDELPMKSTRNSRRNAPALVISGDDDNATHKNKPGRPAKKAQLETVEVQEESQCAVTSEEIPRRTRRNAGDKTVGAPLPRETRKLRTVGKVIETSVPESETAVEVEAFEVQEEAPETVQPVVTQKRARRNAQVQDRNVSTRVDRNPEVDDQTVGVKKVRKLRRGQDVDSPLKLNESNGNGERKYGHRKSCLTWDAPVSTTMSVEAENSVNLNTIPAPSVEVFAADLPTAVENGNAEVGHCDDVVEEVNEGQQSVLLDDFDGVPDHSAQLTRSGSDKSLDGSLQNDIDASVPKLVERSFEVASKEYSNVKADVLPVEDNDTAPDTIVHAVNSSAIQCSSHVKEDLVRTVDRVLDTVLTELHPSTSSCRSLVETISAEVRKVGHEATNIPGLPLFFIRREELSPSGVVEATQESDDVQLTAPATKEMTFHINSGSPIQTTCHLDQTDELQSKAAYSDSATMSSVQSICTNEVGTCGKASTDMLSAHSSEGSDCAKISMKNVAEITVVFTNNLPEDNAGAEIGGNENVEADSDGKGSEDVLDIRVPEASFDDQQQNKSIQITAEVTSNDDFIGFGLGSYCNEKDSTLEVPVEEKGPSTAEFPDIISNIRDNVLTNVECDNAGHLLEDCEGNSSLPIDCFKPGEQGVIQEETENIAKFPFPENEHVFNNRNATSLESPSCSTVNSDVEVEGGKLIVDNAEAISSPNMDHKAESPDNYMEATVLGLEVVKAESSECTVDDAATEIGEDVLAVDYCESAEVLYDRESLPSHFDCIGTQKQAGAPVVVENSSKFSFPESVNAQAFTDVEATSLDCPRCSNVNSDVEVEDADHKPDSSMEAQVASTEAVEAKPHEYTVNGDGNSNNLLQYDDDNENIEATDISSDVSASSVDETSRLDNEDPAKLDGPVANEKASHDSSTSPNNAVEIKDAFLEDSGNLQNASFDGVKAAKLQYSPVANEKASHDMFTEDSGNPRSASINEARPAKLADTPIANENASLDTSTEDSGNLQSASTDEVGVSKLADTSIEDSGNLQNAPIEVGAAKLAHTPVANEKASHGNGLSPINTVEIPGYLFEDCGNFQSASIDDIGACQEAPHDISSIQFSTADHVVSEVQENVVERCDFQLNDTFLGEPGDNCHVSNAVKEGCTDSSDSQLHEAVVSKPKELISAFMLVDSSEDVGAGSSQMEEENIMVESRESSMPQILNSELCSRHHEDDCDEKLSSEDTVLKSNLGYMVYDSYCNRELSDFESVAAESGGSVPTNFRSVSEGPDCSDGESLSEEDSGAALAGLFCEDYKDPSAASPVANTPVEVANLQNVRCSQLDTQTPASIMFTHEQKEDTTHVFESGGSIPTNFRSVSEGPDCSDGESLSEEDSGAAALAGLFCEDYKDPSASPVANTTVEVVNLQNVRCSQLDTQTPASIVVTHEQKEEDTTLVFEVSTGTPNLCDVRNIPDSVEVLSVLSKSDITPANYTEKPAAPLESLASKLMDVCNSGQSHASSPFSLYGLKEGISVEEQVDSENAVRSSGEISLGMSSSQSKVELSQPQGILKEPLVDILDSPSCYQLRQLFSVTSDRQSCEVGSSRLEANYALSRSGKDRKGGSTKKDRKVSSDESPISLSTFWETNADDAEVSLGMSSSRTKREGSSGHDELKETLVDGHDDHKVSSDESPFSLRTFWETNSDDAELSLGMSSSHMKCEASNARDIPKEALVGVHDSYTCSQLRHTFEIESDKQLCQVASSQLEVNNVLTLVDKDHKISSCESPFSQSIFRESNADDAGVTGSQIQTKTMTIAQDFDVELQRDGDLEHSDDTEFIEHSHGNVSTDCEDKIVGDIDDIIDTEEFVGESVKILGTPFSLKLIGDIHTAATTANSSLVVTDYIGCSPRLKSTMSFESSASAEKTETVKITEFLPTNQSDGSSSLQTESTEEAGICQVVQGAQLDTGDYDDVSGANNLVGIDWASEVSDHNQASITATPLETNSKREMAVDINDTSPCHPDENTEGLLTKLQRNSISVVRTSGKISGDIFSLQRNVENCLVENSEEASVDICSSHFSRSPSCQVFLESSNSKMRAVGIDLFKGADEHLLGNGDDEFSSDESSFDLNIFENDNSAHGADFAGLYHDQDVIWESPAEPAISTMGIFDEAVERDSEKGDKIASDIKHIAASEYKARVQCDAIWGEIESTMLMDDLGSIDTLGAHFSSDRVNNLGGENQDAALSSSSPLQALDLQGSSTRREISPFKSVASAKTAENGRGKDVLIFAKLESSEEINAANKSILEATNYPKTPLSQNDNNCSEIGNRLESCSREEKTLSMDCITNAETSITEKGDLWSKFTNQVDEDISNSSMEEEDLTFNEDPEAAERETMENREVEFDCHYNGQGEQENETTLILQECNDKDMESGAALGGQDFKNCTEISNGAKDPDQDSSAEVSCKATSNIINAADDEDICNTSMEKSDRRVDEEFDTTEMENTGIFGVEFECNDHIVLDSNDKEKEVATVSVSKVELEVMASDAIFEGSDSENCTLNPQSSALLNVEFGEDIAREVSFESSLSIDCSATPLKHEGKEPKGRNGPDQMEEISRKLIDFRISSANKFGPTVPRTPLKLHSTIDILKDKENSQLVKMERPPRSNVETPVNASSVRRPLQHVRNNNTVGQ